MNVALVIKGIDENKSLACLDHVSSYTGKTDVINIIEYLQWGRARHAVLCDGAIAFVQSGTIRHAGIAGSNRAVQFSGQLGGQSLGRVQMYLSVYRYAFLTERDSRAIPPQAARLQPQPT